MNIIELLLQVPHVTPDHLKAQFWQAAFPEQNLPLPRDFNQRVYDRLGLPTLRTLPDFPPPHNSFDSYYMGNGERFPESYQNRLREYADPPQLPTPEYGLVTKRTHLRHLPTWDIATNEAFAMTVDFWQESALDLGTPVAITAITTDQHWAYALSPHYWGWLPLADVGLGAREAVLAYAENLNFLLPTTSQSLVLLPQGGGVTPQLGTRLPLLEEHETFYRVQVPRRAEDGKLYFEDGYISKAESPVSGFREGYFPLTTHSLYQLAFEMLGERYAWGDSRMKIFGRDCSRFVRDIYASCGVFLPRNADQQAKVCFSRVEFTPKMSEAERQSLILEHGKVGDLLFTPTHVAMYLGHSKGDPYIIHATGGQFQAVIVSTLEPDGYPHPNSLLMKLSSLGGVYPS